jgi:hypothetical protein
VSIDEQPVALPKLYGAPAYARPPAPAAATPRPFDPDQFPLTVDQTDEDRESMAFIAARAYEPGGTDRRRQDPDGADQGGLRARAFSLRAIAGRLLGGD